MPPNARAELIGGVVLHALPAESMPTVMVHVSAVAYWVASLPAGHPWRPGDRSTPRRSWTNWARPQPDVSLRILPEYGGQTRMDGKYLAGAPELVVEIAHPAARSTWARSSRTTSAAGVREYLGGRAGARRGLLVRTPRRPSSHAPTRRRRPVPLGDFPRSLARCRGVYRRDLARLDAVLGRGLASAEHAEFVERLARARG